MARQIINIGVEGNDGTGDAIRESFRKVNENFNELYSLFGRGDGLTFTSLIDTPGQFLGNQGRVTLVKPDASGLEFFEMVSDAGTNDPSNTENTISFAIEDDKLKVTAVNTKLSRDNAPTVLNPMSINTAAAYNNATSGLLRSNPQQLVTAWNSRYPGQNITDGNLLIDKAYADETYINSSGDSISGPLVTSSITMNGPLTLHDHPSPLSGLGIVNGPDDLQAATKFYVDASSYTNPTTLYVSTIGSDDQTGTPPGRAGRNERYAYRTISEACKKADTILRASEVDLGPYIQTVTYNEGDDSSVVGNDPSNLGTIPGYSTIQIQEDIADIIVNNKTSIINNTVDFINLEFPDFVYNQTTCARDIGIILDSIKLDILASTVSIKHNYLTIFAGLRYFANPSSELASSPQGQQAETVAAINFARSQLLTIIAGTTTGSWYDAVDDRFDDLINIITQTSEPLVVESPNYYVLRITSGLNRRTDQSDPLNPDIIPGKVIRGRTSGAVGRIVTYKRGQDLPGQPVYDQLELELLKAVEFELGEEVEYANRVNRKQLTIKVQGGIYEEHFPIRVPPDVSIVGDDLRRTIIRPKRGKSESPWAKTWFYRDSTIDGLSIVNSGESFFDKDNQLVGYLGYHYLTDPTDIDSDAKNNNELDVFLLNDNNIITKLTVQQHGGFMCVFDPSGQILTRSPYIQNCTCFSKSKNQKAFHGGIFIDGYASNLPVTLIGKNGNFELNAIAPSNSGLGVRKPNTPCSFFYNGERYQVNAIKNYIPDDGNGNASITLILDETSNTSQGFVETINQFNVFVVTIQGGGNKSMLANDFTQINDLGYGVVATNNTFAELVSVFTYYCHAGYYSINGSQIRSLNGNNSYGNFGLVAQGSDPDEVSKIVTLDQNLVQPAKIYHVSQEIVLAGEIIIDSGNRVTQQQLANPEAAIGFVAFSSYDSVNNQTRLYLERTEGSFVINLNVIDSDTSTSLGNVVSVDNRGFVANAGSFAVYAYDFTDYPLNGSELQILHDSGLYTMYEVVTVSDTGILIPSANESELCDSTNASIRRKIWRLDFSSGVTTPLNPFKEITRFGTVFGFKNNQNFILNGIESDLTTRPSTALIFDEQPDFTYRTISFESSIVSGIPVVGVQAKVTIDENYNYINLTVDSSRALEDASTINPSWSGTLGGTPGDTHIIVQNISVQSQTRILNMIFAWAGKLHRVIDYDQVTIGLETRGVVTIEDVYSINPDFVGSGIAATLISPIGNVQYIDLGIEAGQTGTITINISTTRATGHDFLDIGTGSYNQTNFPNRIYGSPVNRPVSDGEAIDQIGNSSKAQVQERIKGRVFFAATDQDGFMRVGRFFTVDQGTGRITFNAAIVLTNIDGIGFRRGVRINEFSADNNFSNARGDVVPTQSAIEGYINRRLGWSRDGVLLPEEDLIGAGAVRKLGDTMQGILNLGNNRITNLADPTNNTDATNRKFVLDRIAEKDSLSKLNDVGITAPQNSDLLIYDSATSKWSNYPLSSNPTFSDVTISLSGGTLSARINNATISNANIKNDAAIAQSKLSLSNSTANTLADAVKGISSFDSTNFESNSGWISIKNDSIANSKLVNKSITIGSTNIVLGQTVSSLSVDTITAQTVNTTNIAISGELTGTITNANFTNITPRNTSSTAHYISFVESTSGFQQNYIDSGLTYIPSTDSLVLGSIVGTNVQVSGGSGEITLTGNILPKTNDPTDSGQSLGSITRRWNTVYATTFNGTATNALYADLAENYLADAHYEPGTVLVFGGAFEVTLTNSKGDRRIAGVVSTEPAHLMNSALHGDYVTPVALQGRVPCKVLGKVEKGDLLVSSAVPGYAIVDNDPKVGTVIGKSLENKTTDNKGIIEVVVGRV
jgi:hypothetical protein